MSVKALEIGGYQDFGGGPTDVHFARLAKRKNRLLGPFALANSQAAMQAASEILDCRIHLGYLRLTSSAPLRQLPLLLFQYVGVTILALRVDSKRIKSLIPTVSQKLGTVYQHDLPLIRSFGSERTSGPVDLFLELETLGNPSIAWFQDA